MKKEQGFIALSAVLILSVIFLTLLTGAVIRSIGLSKSVTAMQASTASASLAHACVTHALTEITQNLEYGGDEQRMFSSGSCQIFPIDDALPDEREVRVEAEVDGHVYRLVVDVAQLSPDVVIHSYQSVISF